MPPAPPPAAEGELVHLAGWAVGTVLGGELSPDGHRFAYEVGRSERRGELRVLDLRSGRTRIVARGPGRRSGPSWSPDGRRIVYWDAEPGVADSAESRDGIWVLDLDGGRERRVFRPPEYAIASSPSWVGPDTIRFAYWPGTLSGGRQTWIVAADGSGAGPVAEGDVRLLPVRSPDGEARAHFENCCGAWARGLFIASAGAERCVAGPMEGGGPLVWSPDRSRLYFLATARGDSLPAVWTSEPEGGGARRIETPGGVPVGLSGGAGVLAVQLRAAHDSIFLWVVDDPAGLPLAADSLAACPGPDPALVRFARREGIRGELRFRDLLRVPEREAYLFTLGWGFSGEGHRFRRGLQVGDHVGWVGGPCRVGRFGDRSCERAWTRRSAFRPRADEAFLWSAEFLDRLAGVGWERGWVSLLLEDPDPPPGLLASLLDLERFDGLLMEHPHVRHKPGWLLEIESRHGRGSRVGGEAFEALWALGPAVVHEPGTPDRLLRRFGQRAGRGRDSLAAPIARALLAHPEAGRDTAILLSLARLPPEVDPTVFRTAGKRLLEDPTVSATRLGAVAPALAADADLAEGLFADPRVRERPYTLLRLARTPWREWAVARRAREILREQAARRADSAGPGVVMALPALTRPDRWEAPGLLKRADSLGVYRLGGRPGSLLDHETASLLAELDPAHELLSHVRRPPRPGAPERPEVERRVCRIATHEEAPADDLARIAEAAVYATSTTIAACLLDNPRIGEHREVLRRLSTMVDLNEDPELPSPGAPTITEVRRRAEGLLGSSDPG